MTLPRDGDQLVFEGEEWLSLGVGHSLPWEGRSPRALTRGYKRFTLKTQVAKSTSDFVDPGQYDLWLPIKKAPWIYQGAPLLGGRTRARRNDHG